MRKSDMVMRKLWLTGKKIVASDTLARLCQQVGAEYGNMIRYLLHRQYLVRIFRGIFYVKSPDEIRFRKIDTGHLELVARGLEAKGVENWYFGLSTALVLNGLTHEYFAVEYVLNDRIFRAREIKVAGHRFRFVKIKPSLFFGIRERERLRYSDLEKTLLDFIYLWRYRGVPEEKIILDISELAGEASRSRLHDYAMRYPRTVRMTLERIF
ncbi:MAG: type IV toxin-antitoxin system AbiEi family antitoxin domain-containing protein [Candidatus Thorarchaeota archaeon]